MNEVLEIEQRKINDGGVFNFDQLFTGILFEYALNYRDNLAVVTGHNAHYNITSVSHARLVRSAINFLSGEIPMRENPLDYLKTSMADPENTLLPWSSRWEATRPIHTELDSTKISEKEKSQIYERAKDRILTVRQHKDGWMRNVTFDQYGYRRIFGQVLSGALVLAHKRMIAEPFVLEGKGQDDFIFSDYLPEGLQRGTLVVKGDVRDYCGKHSGETHTNGGTIVVLGNAGNYLADSAQNTRVCVTGDVLSLGNFYHCDVYIGGKISDERNLESLAKQDNGIVTGTLARRGIGEVLEELKIKQDELSRTTPS